MKCLIVRRVKYRYPCKKRVGWAMVLSEKFGLALAYVPKAEQQGESVLAVVEENVPEHVFEDADCSRLPCEAEDLVKIGMTLQTLGAELSEAEMRRFFQPEDPDDLL